MTIYSILLGIIGGQEIIIIAIIILVLFGGKKIPELMRGLGRGVGEFKKGKSEVMDELNDLTPKSDSSSKDESSSEKASG
ncbi:MAG TPA: twin-arginine translocase TatA/TatE family subunit [Bacteroidales bacterium]|nr:twin-arginine translocase TatA/TatE family subunit [Bacteroidales bacterium]HPS27718.1 twin-arginine translocase TatA/TatE family subunit [Bacteroidales bacterium]